MRFNVISNIRGREGGRQKPQAHGMRPDAGAARPPF